MKRSVSFWLAIACLCAIVLLVADIPKHYIDWQKDFRGEVITAVHDHYNLSQAQRTAVLDNILEANKTLMAQMYIKSFVALLLLALCIYAFIAYRKQQGTFLKAAGLSLVIIALTVGFKVYMWTSFKGDDKIKFLTLSPTDTSVAEICKSRFKGKVVYVDFWGTTCGPCLAEFRNFTPPLKQQFKHRKDIAFLYICGGKEIIWKQQVQKLKVEGTHLFLNAADYRRFFKQAITGDRDTLVAMPRYIVVSKNGEVINTNAPRPSDAQQLSTLLTQQLNPTPTKL